MVNDNFEDYIDKYYLYWQRLVSNSDLKNLFSPIVRMWREYGQGIFRMSSLPMTNLWILLKITLIILCISKQRLFAWTTCGRGQLSMAHGLENRVPFLDNDLTEFAMQCPVSLKLKNFSESCRINENTVGDKQTQFFQQTQDGKQILREVMHRIIPRKLPMLKSRFLWT